MVELRRMTVGVTAPVAACRTSKTTISVEPAPRRIAAIRVPSGDQAGNVTGFSSAGASGVARPSAATRVREPSAPRTASASDEANGPPGSWVGPGRATEAAGDGGSLAAGAPALSVATATSDGCAPLEPAGDALGDAGPPVSAGRPQMAAATTATTTAPIRTSIRSERPVGGPEPPLAGPAPTPDAPAAGPPAPAGSVPLDGLVGASIATPYATGGEPDGRALAEPGFRGRPRRRRLSFQPMEGHPR